MMRLTRRWSTALLWLAIALLPVRGWAVTLMPLTMAAPAPAHALMDAEQVQPAAAPAMPCHGAIAAEPASDEGVTPPPTCSLCDLCHTSVAQAPAPPALPAAPDDALPAAAASSPVATQQSDGLFRPPRSTLA